MATYTYKCSSCNKEEILIEKGMCDPDPTTCPMCKAEDALTQVIGPGTFVLKGSGWFSNDPFNKV